MTFSPRYLFLFLVLALSVFPVRAATLPAFQLPIKAGTHKFFGQFHPATAQDAPPQDK